MKSNAPITAAVIMPAFKTGVVVAEQPCAGLQ
jgi:hypothetical protein